MGVMLGAPFLGRVYLRPRHSPLPPWSLWWRGLQCVSGQPASGQRAAQAGWQPMPSAAARSGSPAAMLTPRRLEAPAANLHMLVAETPVCASSLSPPQIRTDMAMSLGKHLCKEMAGVAAERSPATQQHNRAGWQRPAGPKPPCAASKLRAGTAHAVSG